jgi:hypothetical protein
MWRQSEQGWEGRVINEAQIEIARVRALVEVWLPGLARARLKQSNPTSPDDSPVDCG